MNFQDIKTFEDACTAKGYDTAAIRSADLSKFPEHLRETIQAQAEALIVTEAINGDWEPDYNNDDQRKWFPWFDMEVTEKNPSGFAFWNSHFGRTDARAGLGSRHVFETSDKAKHAGTVFIDM